MSHFERWKWAADWRGLPQPSGERSCQRAGGGDSAVLRIASESRAKGFLCEVFGPTGVFDASRLDDDARGIWEVAFPRDVEPDRGPRRLFIHGMPRRWYLALWYVYDDGPERSITTRFVAAQRVPIVAASGTGVARRRGGPVGLSLLLGYRPMPRWPKRLPWPLCDDDDQQG